MSPDRKREPRVLEVIHGAGWAGTERHVRSLIEGLPALGWRPELVVSNWGPLAELARDRGIPAHHLPRVSTSQYVGSLRTLLRELRPAIVHTHSGRVPAIAARWTSSTGVVDTRHGIPLRMRRSRARARIEGWKSSAAHRTIAVCRADARWLWEDAGVDPSRIRVVPNGVEPLEAGPDRDELRRRHSLPQDRRVLLWVGRLNPEKAPHRFLDLVSGLGQCRGSEEWVAVICGDGPLGPELRARAETLGIGEQIVWRGAQPDAEELIAAADLLCLPSVVEGLPYVLLEALRHGTPVLATPVGGIPELLEGPELEEGCLSWDRETWVTRAAEWIASGSLREKWRRAAEAQVRGFSEQKMLAGVEGVYRELWQPS